VNRATVKSEWQWRTRKQGRKPRNAQQAIKARNCYASGTWLSHSTTFSPEQRTTCVERTKESKKQL